MADAATPAEGEEKKDLKPDAATPAKESDKGSDANVDPNKAAPAEGEDDVKTELEKAQEEVEDLTGELDKTKARQSEADLKSRKLEREIKRLKKDAKNPSSPKPKSEDEDDDDDNPSTDTDAEDRRVAENKISRLLIDPKYRPLLDSDPTLLDVLQRNPLIFVDDFIDAEDALEQTKDTLDERLSKLPAPKVEEKKEEEEDKGNEQFNAGNPNVRGGPSGPKTADQHRKEGNVDMAVETSILDKMKIPRKR